MYYSCTVLQLYSCTAVRKMVWKATPELMNSVRLWIQCSHLYSCTRPRGGGRKSLFVSCHRFWGYRSSTLQLFNSLCSWWHDTSYYSCISRHEPTATQYPTIPYNDVHVVECSCCTWRLSVWHIYCWLALDGTALVCLLSKRHAEIGRWQSHRPSGRQILANLQRWECRFDCDTPLSLEAQL